MNLITLFHNLLEKLNININSHNTQTVNSNQQKRGITMTNVTATGNGIGIVMEGDIDAELTNVDTSDNRIAGMIIKK